MFPRMIPRPIGTSNKGSKSFLIASHIKNMPTTIIMRLPTVALAYPVYVRNSLKLLTIKSNIFIMQENFYPIVNNAPPSITVSPGFTRIEVTVPPHSASILFCIFMASSTITVSPFFTVSPTFTLISVMVPGSGANTFVPAPAAGVAAGAVAGAGAAAGAATGAAAGFTAGRLGRWEALIGSFSSTSKGMPLTLTLAILPSTSTISTS